MKKQVLILLAALCCLCMVACGGDAQTGTKPTAAPSNSGSSNVSDNSGSNAGTEQIPDSDAPVATPTPGIVYEDIYTFEVAIAGRTYSFPTWVSELTAKGWTAKSDLSETLKADDDDTIYLEKDGTTYIFRVYNFSMNEVPLEECVITGFRTDEFYFANGEFPDVVLPTGIKLGVSTKEEILATYGEQTDSYESDTDDYQVLFYEYDRDHYVHLTIEGGLFTGIEMRNDTEPAGISKEVSYAIPDYVANYEPPASYDKAPEATMFKMDDVAYDLPCPVAQLLENGFALTSEYKGLALAAGEQAVAKLRYGNVTLECEVKNFAKYGTVIENCFVTEVKDDDLGIEILGGIKVGMKEADAEALLKGLEYEKEESVHAAYDMGGNIYTLSDYSTYYYYISTDSDGYVRSVTVSSYHAKPENGSGEPTDKEYVPVATVVPDDSIFSFRMEKDGDRITVPMWYSELEAMGWKFQGDSTEKLNPGEESSVGTWYKDNFYINTVFANYSINTVSLKESQITELWIDKFSAELFKPYNGTITLPGGIRLFESTKAEVHAAYGTPNRENTIESNGSTYFMYYSNGEGGTIEFKISETPVEYNGNTYHGQIDSVRMTNKIALEGADNSVSKEAPAELSLYQAPADYKNVYDVVFNMNGRMYQLPCPVSEFVNNGFKIDTANSDEYVPAMNQGIVTFLINNKKMECAVMNLSERATTVENCFVSTIYVAEFDKTVDLTVLKNITFGSSEADLLKALDGLNYKQSGSEYRVENPAQDLEACFYSFYMSDGVVSQITLVNQNLLQ